MPGIDFVRRLELATLATIVAGATLLLCGRAFGDSPERAVSGVEAPRAELSLADSVAAPGGGLINRYRQRVDGLPVLGAEAVVVAVPGAGTELISDSTVRAMPETIDAADLAVSQRSATEQAMKAVGVARLRSQPTAKLGIDRSTGRPAWQVTLPAWRPLGDFEVTIDATTGAALSRRNLIQEATGSAKIYSPNPVVEQQSYAGLKDRMDRDSPLLTSLLIPVTLERLTDTRGCLRGTYVDARLGKRGHKVCAKHADFTELTRSDDEFEAVMAYYHVDRERAYADSLGLSEPLRHKPQRVLANAIPDDNSFYSPADHTLVLGTGGIDDGEDADVISHEYGHSLQDQSAPGSLNTGRQGGTMAEGYGDYMAATMSALTTGGSRWDTCIFDWDGIPYSPDGTCGRTADTDLDVKTAERRCGKEIHCVGQVYSSMLIGLRTSLGNDTSGRSVMDRIVLEANFMGSSKTNYRSTARALLASDQLLYAGAHEAPIEQALVERKFCPASGC